MWRLSRAFDETTFAQVIALDCVGRYENVAWFWLVMRLFGAEKTETFFGNFEKAGPIVLCAISLVAHIAFVCVLPKINFQECPEKP
jgi:hypothetical protein